MSYLLKNSMFRTFSLLACLLLVAGLFSLFVLMGGADQSTTQVAQNNGVDTEAYLLDQIETSAGTVAKSIYQDGQIKVIEIEQGIPVSEVPGSQDQGLKKKPLDKQVQNIQVLPVIPNNDRPQIAVVIDDLGMSFSRLKQLASLGGKMNMAFLPYAENLEEQTKYAKERGHELIVHVPMMPKSKNQELGPIVLTPGMNEQALLDALDTDLKAFGDYVGINNHMGSAFTEDEKGMRVILSELKKRGLFFLDSKTTSGSVAKKIANDIDLPFLQRDVFLDHSSDMAFINKQLALSEKIAKRDGHAIAIGHPYKTTIAALESWVPTLKEKGIDLVFLTDLLPNKKHAVSAVQPQPMTNPKKIQENHSVNVGAGFIVPAGLDIGVQ